MADTILSPADAWKGWYEPQENANEFPVESQYSGGELTTVGTDDSNTVDTVIVGDPHIVGARFEFDVSAEAPTQLIVTAKVEIDEDSEVGDFILRIWDPTQEPPTWETIDTEVDPTEDTKYTLSGEPSGALANYIDGSNKVYICIYYDGLQYDPEEFRAYYAELNIGSVEEDVGGNHMMWLGTVF